MISFILKQLLTLCLKCFMIYMINVFNDSQQERSQSWLNL